MKHVLRRGETLEMLSVRYGIPVCMLVKANRGKRIVTGQSLTIPRITFCENGRSYLVQAGDTLYSIAQKNNTTMYDLCKENPGLSSGRVSAGMLLRLPQAEQIYTCGVLDTVASVCEKFGITEEALRSCNSFEKNLYVIIKIIKHIHYRHVWCKLLVNTSDSFLTFFVLASYMIIHCFRCKYR